jgi:hypothetical protein
MAEFNYKLLTELQPITTPSCSVFVNTAATASYVRTIHLHSVSGSTQNVSLWKVPSGATASNANRFFNSSLSGSSTFMIEFGNPGFMVTQSGDSIWASTSNNGGVNIMIVGGVE